MSDYIHFKVWDEITFPFPNFNGCAVEVWEWISNITRPLYRACDYLSMLGLLLWNAYCAYRKKYEHKISYLHYISQRRKCHRFDAIFIISCIERKLSRSHLLVHPVTFFFQNDVISISVWVSTKENKTNFRYDACTLLVTYPMVIPTHMW